jgi:DNA-binding transcriptional MocR family regulator
MPADQRICWNRPRGGLFLDVEVPRRLTIDDVMHSGEHGVIWIPLSLFTDQPRFQNHIRLAIGTVAEADIGVGVTRLAEFLFGRLRERTVA